MRHHRLFAAGLAAALMLGAVSPALADGKGKAKGKPNHGQTKEKPGKGPKPKKAKKSHFHVSGGGTVVGGTFSLNALRKKPSNGHYDFASTTGDGFKVRCHDGWVAPTTEPTLTAYPRTFDLTFKNCLITGLPRQDLVVTVIDNGQPTEPKVEDGQPAVAPVAPVVLDAMRFSLPGPVALDGTPTTTTWGGDLIEGNVKIRNK